MTMAMVAAAVALVAPSATEASLISTGARRSLGLADRPRQRCAFRTTQRGLRAQLGRDLAIRAVAEQEIASDSTPADNNDFDLYANDYDLQRASVYSAREQDWRSGAIVLVDRFAPSEDLETKRDLYPDPKKLRDWSEKPRQGVYLEEEGVWSHEIDFWGGDLQSLRSRLNYIKDLGADVVYLNPIHLAYTNHKYDALDYFSVSPEFGKREDVIELADECHRLGMKLVLDGVFNHVGQYSEWFQAALADPNSKIRKWFFIDDEYKLGYRAWYNAANLPELRMEDPELRGCIYGDPDSVVQGYLRDGVDGWRLDVAFDLGFNYLRQLTDAAHSCKPGSLVLGEVWNYPEEWFPSLDAMLNMYARQVILFLVKDVISGAHAGRLLDRMIQDAGLEPVLRSWLVLDNHDVSRLRTSLPDQWQERMAQVLQFTLPGSPCIYYGVELGMEGGEDPEQRGPMEWDQFTDDNPHLQWMRKLIALRNSNRALRIGDFRLLDSERLLAFMRRTEFVEEMVIVMANPTDEEVTETVPVRESKIMNGAFLQDELGEGGSKVLVPVHCGLLVANVPPRTVRVLRLVKPDGKEYSSYKRVL
eukprot:jgi/Chlat1/7058/Chrsp56S06722